LIKDEVVYSDYQAELKRRIKSDAVALLKHYEIKILEKFKDSVIEMQIIEGKPKLKLVEFVQLNNPDCLVIGSRGLDILQRTFMGSTGDYCTHNCKCPVLVIKHP
jgi:nucleotide-binding universal stress UspA family protein